ncbi:ribosome small subunit-dependent GTPase A [Pseudooceanicola sp. 216_PA32_1]|uniref:Small ribosomal subunit biogenesis GTPase RsgA n=1 Tax=Pseudooceanicola pacificus TaxID=2676438 RepID=A0A844W6T2_9RHOB|nr:ribosome small subunit-dependent GTPase A [Pseudooceanicola pacificus]MWB76413.1 ribosome small subunit-dependent GTPase A [Pseudooceanicola pacificus]
MVRDYSRFFPPADTGAPAREPDALQRLGWQAFFIRQAGHLDLAATPPLRVSEVQRSGLTALGADGEITLPPMPGVTVGDWLLHDRARPARSVLLDRRSLFRRRAAGTGREEQLIAANVDTLFIVSSCNNDFNPARLERYLALAHEAGVEAAILLTKADASEDPGGYADRAKAVARQVPVLTLNALEPGAAARLQGWCGTGQTVAFVGSSGVGKSTLVNALMGAGAAQTGAIREDDSRGRHTTTARQLHLMPGGGLLLDTPGMRELQLTDAAEGIAGVFADIEALARQCRFRDCGHDSEPGCAVRAAVDRGALEPGRIARWRKLLAEDRFNSAALHERRARDKAFGKMVRNATGNKAKRRDG